MAHLKCKLVWETFSKSFFQGNRLRVSSFGINTSIRNSIWCGSYQYLGERSTFKNIYLSFILLCYRLLRPPIMDISCTNKKRKRNSIIRCLITSQVDDIKLSLEISKNLISIRLISLVQEIYVSYIYNVINNVSLLILCIIYAQLLFNMYIHFLYI